MLNRQNYAGEIIQIQIYTRSLTAYTIEYI